MHHQDDRRWGWGLFLLLVLLPVPGLAEIVSLDVGGQVEAVADYRVRDADKPAVLVLHGFLQTRSFSTVARLTDALTDAGYTTLTPTLSLGIHRRVQSLACEAIHTHRMESDVAEIAMWVDWLVAQGHREVMLVGHSTGSVTELAYLAGEPNPAVQRAVLVSLVPFGEARLNYETEAMAQRARQALAEGRDSLDSFGLAYCREYPARPSAFLSYYDWSNARITRALGKVGTPLVVIVGTNDQRMTATWFQALDASGADVVRIEGANHFFDDMYEFDLLDATLEALAQ